MPKRISKKFKDTNQIAAAVVALSTAEEPPPIEASLLSKVMAEMGRNGGKIGGKRSMETMTPAERKKRSQKAAKTRWRNSKKK